MFSFQDTTLGLNHVKCPKNHHPTKPTIWSLHHQSTISSKRSTCTVLKAVGGDERQAVITWHSVKDPYRGITPSPSHHHVYSYSMVTIPKLWWANIVLPCFTHIIETGEGICHIYEILKIVHKYPPVIKNGKFENPQTKCRFWCEQISIPMDPSIGSRKSLGCDDGGIKYLLRQ